MNLIENLNWRYATKKMNGQTVSEEKLETILDAIQLSPSSSGLQPFNVFVISDKELLAKIQPIAMGQSQITKCSHLLVFAAWENYTLEKLEKVFNYTLSERGLPLNTMDDYKNNLWGMYSQLPEDWHAHHAAKQAYIALGIGLTAAAEQKVDATPMEGFDPNALDELLNLKEKGLKSSALLALGYRDSENDWLANMKKVRKPKNELFIKL
ncbi:NAD(P)H-dependent oxidoreductase [Polaribacter reichenbachii]|uniref:NAD(P)H-dependent oxidoreductase n=1 Tax=Polaribacter reichenbachii TaxID=996801 RepID=A0A1B8U2H3_9FLAO|nr:NAD(P)H-dependent oxidoreductase [Polaribacter reichenbachii]APZ47379.1 NAD(P)H-dependent oxidoreductase [Polaribacter reichenbachii]AUC18020.1 NAD(P)H-dependent oxidoreductase [Polaribacter reichenbachii]OBY66066.1 NAD(P)H-dependent oxidoreductase [Polaribacter reichenbachii]